MSAQRILEAASQLLAAPGISCALAGLCFLNLPEPAAVYGPRGSRWVTSGKTSQASAQVCPEAA